MELKTTIEIKPTEEKIHPHDRITSIGSCFADHIGSRFEEMKMDILSNPYGIIYNPISQMRLIKAALNDEDLREDHIIENRDIYNHLDAHSIFGKKNLIELKEGIREASAKLKDYLESSKVLILTFGTAWVYRYEKTQEIIANCHKLPSQNFNKELLELDEIISEVNATLKLLKEKNPDLRIILTVSPVRHIKDGIPENMLSKSILRLAAHKIKKSLEKTYYFPSFELMLDDLRDYRFYAEDMIHPNNVARNFIWQRFRETFFSEPLFAYCDKWQSIKNDLNHRVMNPGSEEHIQFLEALQKKLNRFSVMGNVEAEIEHVEKELENAKTQ
ncbi:GSCFA domain-containing protein [Marivirga arenosa]|uniref:GSCFA domain-containing protein n=1 Tax=Marivirga arenosa TaxID=3059076 RepID=A0AA52EZY3_9BACT|nr:GSCFA domain-containing protein [Marivirga sp. BKB1-2]WNB18816.1 GSCFA domain-containing protein [Marivirga sp. BKB1-2]